MQIPQTEYRFGWQGGEPTLIGLDFFKEAVTLQFKNLPPGACISNTLQTNATYINWQWAEFLARHRFLVGVSLDGPENIHDYYRRYIDGKGSYYAVINGINNLKRFEVDYNILTLVSQANVRRPLEVYRFLRDELKCFHHQYIECVEFNSSNQLLPFAIKGEEWGSFLCAIFDEWISKDVGRVSIRLFDSILSQILNNSPTLCAGMVDCRHYLVIEFNGDIYPCDFFVETDKKLGNVADISMQKVFSSEAFKGFGAKKANLAEKCDSCVFLRYCAGDCIKNRYGRDINSASVSALCEGWQQFYRHALPAFEKLAQKIKFDPSWKTVLTTSPKRIGRNDPCICGSGKKYKNCCLK